MPAKNTKPAAPAPRKAGKRGRLAPVPVVGVAELKAYAATPLPAPPAAVAPPKVAEWGMDGNGPDPTVTIPGDESGVGDCTIAGAAHGVLAWNAEVGTKDAVPSADQVVTQYFALTGGPDNGLACTTVLQTWRTTGLFGTNKIAAWAPVNHKQIIDLHQAVDAYGACYIGVNLPDSAETQFENNEPWSYVGDPPTGGHCVTIVGYEASYVYVVSWGALVPVTYPWLSAYLEEAYAIVPQEFVEAGKGPTLNLAALQADLDSMNATPTPAPKPKPKPRPWWDFFGSVFRRRR